MTDRAATSPAVPPYRLRTFGTLALVGAGDDTVLGRHGHHHRRLALLAVLAVAGARGLSRDQLLPLFWADATPTRARHSLEQFLYALRGSLGDALFAGANPVSLNPRIVSSDVGAFVAAIESGDLEAAAAAYSGPFVDGFYLNDAPEFERWVEAERARLARRHAGVLERLARRATDAGDRDGAVRWWRALADADPLATRGAVGLVRALMDAGDHAAAIQHARRHETLVARELGVGADPTLVALVDGARARTKGGVARSGAAASESSAAPAPGVVAPAERAPGAPPSTDPRPAWKARLVVALALVALALVALALLLSVLLRV